MTQTKRQKFNFIDSGAVDIIRTAYYIHGPQSTKLNFCHFVLSWMTGLTHCY